MLCIFPVWISEQKIQACAARDKTGSRIKKRNQMIRDNIVSLIMNIKHDQIKLSCSENIFGCPDCYADPGKRWLV